MLQLANKLAEATCEINGTARPASECTKVAKSAAGVIGVLLLIGFAMFVWWITTLVHVIKNEDVDNRVLWIVLHFVGLGIFCAPVYFFAVKRPYEAKRKGGQGPVPPQPTSTPPPVAPPESPAAPAA